MIFKYRIELIVGLSLTNATKNGFLTIDAQITLYFDTQLLIIYLSGIETLICHGEIEFNSVYFLRFCTKYVT